MNKFFRCCAIMQKHLQINPGHRPVTKSPALFQQSHGYESTNKNNPIFAEETRFLSSSDFLMDEMKKLDFIPLLWNRLKEMVEYTVLVPSSRLRSLSMIYIYRNLKKNYKDFTEDKDIEKLYIMAWCAEFIKVWTAIPDDWVDDSKYRYGRVTWAFKQADPKIVVYDADLLRETINKFICTHFGHDKGQCIELLKVFQDCVLSLAFSEIIELEVREATKASKGNPGALNGHTRRVYDEVTNALTRSITFNIPQWTALTLARQRDEKLEKILAKVHVNLSKLYQEQDDISDIFVDPNWTGRGSADTKKNDSMFFTSNSTDKRSIDIHNGDFNTVLLTALEICSPAQRRVLEKNYGMDGDQHEQEVMKVFKDLDVENICKKRVAERFEIAKEEIKTIPNDVLRDTHYHLLDALMVKNNETYAYADK